MQQRLQATPVTSSEHSHCSLTILSKILITFNNLLLKEQRSWIADQAGRRCAGKLYRSLDRTAQTCCHFWKPRLVSVTEKATQWKQTWTWTCFYSVVAVRNVGLIVQRLLFVPGEWSGSPAYGLLIARLSHAEELWVEIRLIQRNSEQTLGRFPWSYFLT